MLSWRLIFSASLVAAVGLGLGGVIAEYYKRRSREPRTPVFYSIITFITFVALVLGHAGLNTAAENLLFTNGVISDALEEFQWNLQTNDAFKKAVAGMSPSEVDGYTATLSRDGLKRLSLKDLREWNHLRLKAALKDPSFCESLWGNQAFINVSEAFSKLTLEEHAKMLKISEKAALLDLKNASYQLPPKGAFNDGLEEIANGLPDSEVQRFRRVILEGNSARPEEGCFAIQRIMAGVEKLPTQEQEGFLRAMATL